MLRLGIRFFGERGATFQCSVYMLAVAGLLRQLEQRAAEEAERAADRAASAAPTVRDQGGASRAAAGAAATRVAPPRAEEEPEINWAIGARASFAFARRLLVPPRRVRWADWWPCAAYMVWDEPDQYVTGAAGAGTTTTTYLQCVRVARRPPPSSFARCRPPSATTGMRGVIAGAAAWSRATSGRSLMTIARRGTSARATAARAETTELRTPNRPAATE